jgi:hypothetical protein
VPPAFASWGTGLIAATPGLVAIALALAALARIPSPVPRAQLRVVAQVALVVLRLDVRDVQEPVPSHREVRERRLDGRLEVDDLPLVNVAGVTLVTGPLQIELLEHAILDDGDAALLGLEDINEHLFFHAINLSV